MLERQKYWFVRLGTLARRYHYNSGGGGGDTTEAACWAHRKRKKTPLGTEPFDHVRLPRHIFAPASYWDIPNLYMDGILWNGQLMHSAGSVKGISWPLFSCLKLFLLFLFFSIVLFRYCYYLFLQFSVCVVFSLFPRHFGPSDFSHSCSLSFAKNLLLKGHCNMDWHDLAG